MFLQHCHSNLINTKQEIAMIKNCKIFIDRENNTIDGQAAWNGNNCNSIRFWFNSA